MKDGTLTDISYYTYLPFIIVIIMTKTSQGRKEINMNIKEC